MSALAGEKQLSVNLLNTENLSNTLGDLVDQAIHDIQSPLGALRSLMEKLSGHLTTKEREILVHSFDRADSILDSLKKKEQSKTSLNQKTVSLEEIIVALDNVVHERLLATNFAGNIVITKNVSRFGILNLDLSELSRSLANILNNAIEASIDNRKSIYLAIETDCRHLIFKIQDEGRGISESQVKFLGKKGATFNKINGSGIGLFQVRNFINSCNGQLEITSQEGEGTLVEMRLPLINVGGESFFDYVLIDNDELVRLTWEAKAKIQGVSLLTLSGPELLPNFFSRISKTKTQIYIDSDLDNLVRGEFVAKSLYESGYKNLYMATGHDSEHFKNYHFLKRVGKKPAF